MIEVNNIDAFLAQIFFGLTAVSILTAIAYIYFISKEQEHQEFVSNYKNISQMAQNLATCKPSTRIQVLTELYNDPDWSFDEVDELKSVLEGMLDTRLFINKPGEAPNKGLKVR